MIPLEPPIKGKQIPPVLNFPDRCVSCGKSNAVIVIPLKMNLGIQVRGRAVFLDLPVPLCGECEQRERKITDVTLAPSTIGALVSFMVGFFPAWLFSPEGIPRQPLGFPSMIGPLGGIAAGLIGGSLVGLSAGLLLAPVYRKLLLKWPLTAFSLFNDSEDVTGLSARLSKR